ncbi:MAG: hypothetical protein AB1758_12520 [Candidatus Eremiobacterota bacterium]
MEQRAAAFIPAPRGRPRSGMMLAVVLVFAVVAAILLGALLSRLEVGRRAIRHRQKAPAHRYDGLSALNLVLERVNAGEPLSQAVGNVSRETGVELLLAGDSMLAHSGDRYLQVRLQPASWDHILFGESLQLAGVQGAFSATDPHAPAQGRSPRPSAGFLQHYRDEAVESGVYLANDPLTCQFHPGGGNWVLEQFQGGPSFLYVGGGLGESLGWGSGVYRWAWNGTAWVSSSGEEFRYNAGRWTFSTGSPSTSALYGTLLVEGDLAVQGDALLKGRVIVWGGGMQVRSARLEVDLEDSQDCLGVAVLRGSSQLPVQDWNADPTVHAGDLVLLGGGAQLRLGDPARPDETGGVLFAESRLVKRGQGLELVGAGTSRSIELSGVPADALTWSPRVAIAPPPQLEGGMAVLARPLEVRSR